MSLLYIKLGSRIVHTYIRKSKWMVNFIKQIFKIGDELQVEKFINNFEIEHNLKIKVKKLKRARRIILRVCEIHGEVQITIPLYLRLRAFTQFMDQHLEWIKSKKRNIHPQLAISEGISLPVFGLERTILADPYCKAEYRLTSNLLTVPKKKLVTQNEIIFKHQIRRALIQIAYDFFYEDCKKYADKLGVSFLKISIKDTRSRWGSCSEDKKLMFSWRLVMAPKEVSSYVAAHEVAHLVHMNHSKEFWTIVNFLCADYLTHRSWLRKNGKQLHKFLF